MKRMTVALVLTAAICIAAPVFAVPTLQLDIEGGVYDWASESIMTASGDFTLYAILTPDKLATLDDYYFLSISVIPQLEEDYPSALGSFYLDGDQINVPEEMNWGKAPLTAILPDDQLAGHGVFPTYYYEYQFQFTDANVFTAQTYNVQDDVPKDNSTSYFKPFVIEGAYLNDGYTLHFDLYNAHLLEDGGYNLSRFAPFSHDAQVPEPGSLLLLGIGMVGLAGMRKRLSA